MEEARAVMEKFRAGDLNILVSTSVLSEGIDIPDCKGLIKYMFITDVVAQVQESGMESLVKVHKVNLQCTSFFAITNNNTSTTIFI